jgi:hypothetical protein
MKWDRPSIADYGTLSDLTQSHLPGGPEDCGGKHGVAAGHSAPPGPACPSGH